jgi:hypothetical protein
MTVRGESLPRVRDYRAEYQNRLERAAARGLSRSQARGHARHHEVPVRPRSAMASDARLEAALRELHKRGNLTEAAKLVGVSSERVRRFVRENGYAERAGKGWRVTDTRRPQMRTFSEGEEKFLVLRDRDQASINGVFLNAVRKFTRSNKYDLIRPFIGTSIIDAKGKAHPLETDPNALHELASVQDNYVDVYRLVQK